MNTKYLFRFKHFLLAAIFSMLVFACERDVDNLELASPSVDPEVFIDGFSGGLNYAAFGGAVPTAFNVDNNETYNNSKASMRFDVPNEGDPAGSYAGGVFFTQTGRDLSQYNVLTFWAKATQAATIGEIGFGNDLGENKYVVSISNLDISTNWRQYMIPIPDPEKLKSEKGLFWYSAGNTDGMGFSFWIDEVKYEKLGTVAHPQYAIYQGEEKTLTSYTGVTTKIDGLTSSLNMPTGINQTVNATSAYFEFLSSDESIATVNNYGTVEVIGGPGTAEITATVAGIEAEGALIVDSKGDFPHAPTPALPAEDVISVFSDAYTNTPVDYFNGYWEPYQTTLSADFEINNNHILHYYEFNFVGIQTSPINATTMTHLHLDIYLPNNISANSAFKIEMNDHAGGGGGAYTRTIQVSESQQWIALDIPLTSFAGLSGRTAIWQIVFVGDGKIKSFYADNIYFHK